MKIRIGFVSNSSSASFVIDKQPLTPSQIAVIQSIIKNDYIQINGDGWNVKESEHFIELQTVMDNGELFTFLKALGVLDEAIKKEKEGG